MIKQLVYPTLFCCAGWGLRRLTNKEVGDCQGIALVSLDANIGTIPPLQVLKAHLHQLVTQDGDKQEVLSSDWTTPKLLQIQNER